MPRAETARRLPGIRVDAAPVAAPEALPRMDIAVFVGIASTGPLHLPVALDGVAQYAAVFGPDAPLAWDATAGAMQHARLGPAVRAFFANGGRRCWVIRVARSAEGEALRQRDLSIDDAQALPDIARSNHYALPGILQLNADGALQPAIVQARCEGSWSDPLRLASALTQRAVTIESLEFGSPASERGELATRQPLRAGELLRFAEGGVSAYAVVQRASLDANAAAWRCTLEIVAAFEEAAAWLGSPSAIGGNVTIEGFVEDRPATLTGPVGGFVELRTDAPPSPRLQAGHWARIDAGGETLWMRVDEHREQPLPAAASASPAASPAATSFTLRGPAWHALPRAWPVALTTATSAQRLALELRCDGAGPPQTLAEVGMSPLHATPWWSQQSDAQFHRSHRGLRAPTAPRLAVAPLAAESPLAWIPLGVQSLFGAATSALPSALTPIERDGLARFDDELFVDPALAGDDEANLLLHAEALRSLQDDPRELLGMHALLQIGDGGSFDAASLLALPDALHAGWQLEPLPADEPWPAEPEPAPAPDFSVFRRCAVPAAPPPPPPPAPAPPILQWQAVDPATLGSAQADALEQRWLRLHRAALRLAAASGELFAVLALPRHYRSAEAVRHAARLRSVRGADGAGPDAIADPRTLSFGALVHPWLVAAQPDARPGAAKLAQAMPPDGAMLGVMAGRAARRGAWIAPANQPLADLIALEPWLPERDWQALQDAQVNVIRSDPRGLLALSADTLALDADAELRPINVRRLLSLLRRLALRRGARWVFEPMGAVLRRAVQRSFDESMGELFRRGAFAGKTPAGSFRVVTGPTVQSARDAEAGRLVVELRVAPSLPMRFVGVRLVQSGERLSVVESL